MATIKHMAQPGLLIISAAAIRRQEACLGGWHSNRWQFPDRRSHLHPSRTKHEMIDVERRIPSLQTDYICAEYWHTQHSCWVS
jgi:hypothetical protein